MCTNHTGIGSLPEAMYTKNDIRCRTHGMVRQASARQTIGLGWGHVESAMLDLLKNKPYLHSNAPRPAVENRRDTNRRRLRWWRRRSCTVINRWWIQRWGRWSSTINGRRWLWWRVERRLTGIGIRDIFFLSTVLGTLSQNRSTVSVLGTMSLITTVSVLGTLSPFRY